jgi:antitoxin VapB
MSLEGSLGQYVLTGSRPNDNHLLMTTTAKVFASGRSQAIRLPKDFRVTGKEVMLTRVPGGILISEGDPWDAFDKGCHELGAEFFDVMDQRGRKTPQHRDFTAGLP